MLKRKRFFTDVFPKVYPPCQDIQASPRGIQRQRWKEEERESGEKQQQPPLWDSVKLTTDNDTNYTTVLCVGGYHIKGKEVNENLYCIVHVYSKILQMLTHYRP